MNLSYWERTSFLQNYDYTIVGAGIVGLFTAIEIMKRNANAKVLVLERSSIPDGASTKNAGFACFGSISEIIEHRNKTTEQEFKNLLNKRVAGLKKMREELGDKNINYIPSGGYEIFSPKDKLIFQECNSSLKDINSALENIFDDDVYELKDDDIFKNQIDISFYSNQLFEEWKKINNLAKKAEIVSTLLSINRTEDKPYFHIE